MRWNEHVKIGLYFLTSFSIIACCLFACKSSQKIKIQQANASTFRKSSFTFVKQFRDTNRIKKRYLRKECKDTKHFFYDEKYPFLHEKKNIRVNFHFVNSLDSAHNFNPDKGIKYAKELIKYANGKMRDNVKMNLPEGNDTPVHPVPFRYVLTKDGSKENDTGVYFHYIENPFFVNEGKNKNNYDRSVINELTVNKDTVLNIFYMAHHPDSIKSKTYRGKPSGIALGHTVKLGVNTAKKVNSWTHSGLLNHEVGHILSLSHSWTKNDGCDDTPKHENCWNSGPAPCDGAVSNNVMDYNSIQMSYTPCQIAKTFRTLMNEKSSKRDLVIKDWCHLNEEKTIIVRDTQVWNRTVDVYGNLIIEDKGLLISNCGINMPENSQIYVKAGGTLLLNNSLIKNDCNKSWKGILYDESSCNSANILYLDTFKLQNVVEEHPLTN